MERHIGYVKVGVLAAKGVKPTMAPTKRPWGGCFAGPDGALYGLEQAV